MDIKIRKASADDAELIANARVALLDEASGPLTGEEKSGLYASNKACIQEGLRSPSLVSFLAFDGDTLAGTCSATLYQVMPGIKLPEGKQAYLQNMYVAPEYRRRGIGRLLLAEVIKEAAERGHTKIILHASDMGRILFSKFGFAEENVALTHMVYHAKQGGGVD